MIRAGVFSVAMAVSLSGSIARAQRDARLDKFSPELRAEVLAIADSAARAGLPREPLFDIALKGRTMGHPPDAIVQAVRTVATKLQRARDVLGGGTEKEIEAAAGALGEGVAPSTLQELRRARPGKDLTTQFGLLESMILKGVQRDSAAKAMRLLIVAGVPDSELTEWWEMVQRAYGVGAIPPAEIVARAGSVAEGAANDLGTQAQPTRGAPTGNPPPPRPIPPQRP